MKTNFKNIGLILLATLSLISCNNDDEIMDQNYIPSATAFNGIKETALNHVTQSFQLNATSGVTTFTSTKGVKFDINPSCLTLNGNPITSGTIAIQFAEVFDGGTMLVTDKTTMGKLPNGDMSMLVSGGEIFLKATLNGQQLTPTCPISVRIPANLTAPDNAMTLWDGVIDQDGNVDWNQQQPNPTGQAGVFLEQGTTGQTYYAFFNSFGWTNVDRFYSYTGPKTQILSSVPSGYNATNSAVYLHYDGEGNALAKLDTYDTNTGLFSEHYGQVPIGLACHIIFATEENGQWRYAIKSVTISANTVYNFTLAETTLGSESQLIAAINALP